MTQRKKPELLVPAGSLEVLKTAVVFGADAVYIGGEAFGLRAKAKNFTPEEMAAGIAFAHAHGVKVYITANIFAHNEDLTGAAEYFGMLRDMEPEPCDALIISDPGMFTIARRVWPDAEIHISTQANNTNYETFLFWHKLGAKRVVAARELSMEEIRDMREHIPEGLEIECFVHGAMCISYSGRCLLSNYFTGRDANRGACTHPCRWKYAVVEETRPGEYMPVEEDERGTYLFNSKDLCMIEHIPELVEAGIDSLKIEGRMKTALYVAAVARTYRKAIDDFFESPSIYASRLDWYREEVAKCTHRPFSTGFYFGKPQAEDHIYGSSTYVSEYIYLGTVEKAWRGYGRPWERSLALDAECGGDGAADWFRGEIPKKGTSQDMEGSIEWKDGNSVEEDAAEQWLSWVRIEQRNKFCVGDSLEIMKPDGQNVEAVVEGIYTEDGQPMESCPHAKQTLWIALSEEAEQYDLLRVWAENPTGFSKIR